MDERLPRIQDVAREAGVSTATVSRTLSHPAMVADATREAVMRAVERTGYRVNQAARNLRQGRTNVIVALVPNLGNPFFSEVVAGIESEASRAGFNVLVCDTTQHRPGANLASDFLRGDRCDGLIVLDGTLSREIVMMDLTGATAPEVVFACEWTDDVTIPSVTIDNREGAALAIRHLHALGHTRIGHVAGPEGNVLTDARREGMISELSALGLEIRPEWFLAGDFRLESGMAAARRWLAMRARPTAMFCSSDQMAFGFISTVVRAGLSTPRDVSVVGFDDIDIAAYFMPSLTTIRQPRFEIGSRAAAILADRIAGRPATGERPARLPVELIVRESTSAPSA